MHEEPDLELRLLRSAQDDLTRSSTGPRMAAADLGPLIAQVLRDGSSHLTLAKSGTRRHRRTPVHQHHVGAA